MRIIFPLKNNYCEINFESALKSPKNKNATDFLKNKSYKKYIIIFANFFLRPNIYHQNSVLSASHRMSLSLPMFVTARFMKPDCKYYVHK